MSSESATFFIKPTPRTPFVEFNCNEGKLDIIGKRAPESSPEFYEQVNVWIKEYLSVGENSLKVNISFEDCEIKSNEDFFDLLKALKPAQKEVLVNWYYYGNEGGNTKSLQARMDELGITYKKHSYNV